MSINFPNRSDARDGAAGCSWFVIALIALFGAGVLLLVFSFAFGWVAVPFQTHGVENVKKQYQQAYDFDASMTNIATQYCTAATAAAQETNPTAKTQRDTQRIAQENNYGRVKSQYDANMRDTFRAKNVKPDDLPLVAPTLQERVKTACGH